MKTGRIRVAAIYIDCPTPGCGGGVKGSDGWFILDSSNLPDIEAGQGWQCDECGKAFRIPASFKKLHR